MTKIKNNDIRSIYHNLPDIESVDEKKNRNEK